jgi:PAS domain S-box-containing protein
MGTTPPSETLRETLAVFDAFEPVTTPEVADRLDIGRRTAYARLDRLADSGCLETKKVGANARVWWVPPDGGHERTGGGVDSTGTDGTGATLSGGERRDGGTDERTARERELERYERLLEESKDVNAVVDREGRFQYITPSVTNVFGYEREELVGEVGFEYIHPEDRERAFSEFAAMVERPAYEPTIEFRFRHRDGSWIVLEALGRNLLEDPVVQGLVVYTRDVTERTRRERELERYETIVETVDDGLDVVDEAGCFTGVNGTYEALVGRDRAALLGAHVSTVVDDERILAEAKRLEAQLAAGERSTATLEADITGPDGELRVGEATFALMETDEGYERIGVVRDVTDRRERERELERQREQLAALNSIDEVVRETTRAVIEESTRGEIERTVCDRLAASDSYAFAWVGDADAATGTLNLRTESGVENYLEDVTIPVDADVDDATCPAAAALRTGDLTTVRDVDPDDAGDCRQRPLADSGCRSAAAIPITHDGTVYGVLSLYTDRSDAFTGEERSVLAGLGDVVGHAIAATERKRALMGDDLVELAFQVRDVFADYDLAVEQRGRLELDHAVPVGDGAFLVYGTASAEAAETLPSVVEAVPLYESVSFDADLDVDGGPARDSDADPDGDTDGDSDADGDGDVTLDGDGYGFEIRMTDPPILSVVASLGGTVESAVVEDGELALTVHLAPSVDVRQVIDAVEAAYPGAEMLRRRQISRTGDERRLVRRRLAAELTERQRTALEVAYHAGFFDWPRGASGEDLADSLGVAPPTVHQHLRKAERKVLDELFATDGPTTGL